MKLVLHTGNQALTHVSTKDFQLRWAALYGGCPWATAFQHPDFVVPWYELYSANFLPVVVSAEDEDNALTGLLTLAFDKNSKQLVGAGERQAEYQGWLERKGAGNIFIQETVQKIRAHFPGVDLCLKYLPRDIPLNWILDRPAYAKIFSLRSHARPIMKIDAAAMSHQRGKKNNRQKLNRLKKSGDVQFERITEHDRFSRIFDDVCVQYDLRQGALYHTMPFSSDPSKKPFYLELHKRGLLHTTVLTVDGEVVASHSGVISNDTSVHLGISTHAPAFAAHSPGKLLLAMLGVQLVDEDIGELDLTPGGDSYKENYANEHDVVFELTAYADIRARLKKETFLRAKRFLKSRIHEAGLRTADVWGAVGKMTRFKEIGFHGFLERLRAAAIFPPRLYRYCADKPLLCENPLFIARDCLSDIVRFDPRGSLVTRWEFLNMAMERLERSNHLFSFSTGYKLLMCCWVGERFAETAQKTPGLDAAVADNSFILFDLYVQRQLKDPALVRRFVEQILFELKQHHDNKNIYFCGVLNEALQAVIGQCGFIVEPGTHDDFLPVASLRSHARFFSRGA